MDAKICYIMGIMLNMILEYYTLLKGFIVYIIISFISG